MLIYNAKVYADYNIAFILSLLNGPMKFFRCLFRRLHQFPTLCLDQDMLSIKCHSDAMGNSPLRVEIIRV